MSEIRALLERYLRDGRYTITREITNGRIRQTKVMLVHQSGKVIGGRETLWIPLLDAEDEAFARRWLEE
jgi:hypothetical protein